jgi:hypothetical protein
MMRGDMSYDNRAKAIPGPDVTHFFSLSPKVGQRGLDYRQCGILIVAPRAGFAPTADVGSSRRMESRGAPRTGPAGRLDRVRFIPRYAGAIGRALRRSSGSQARPLGLIGSTTAFWRGVQEAIDKGVDQGPVCLIMIRSGHHVVSGYETAVASPLRRRSARTAASET